MKNLPKKRIGHLARIGILAMALAAEPAQAVDIRSWDKNITNVANRFITLSTINNLAVLDKESQVVWELTPDNTANTWFGARNTCVKKELGGKAGWRLPTIQELASLIDSTQNNPAIKSGNPFLNVSTDPYWSGTKASLSGSSDNAWTLDFEASASGGATFATSGAITLSSTSATKSTWCVRSPLTSQSG